MALDEVARRLADSIFRKALIRVPEQQQQALKALANQHSARGSILSGAYVHDYCELVLRGINELAQAKVEGLLRAYQQSGLLFDEAAFQEVKREVADFCHSQQHGAIGALPQAVHQRPPGAINAASNGIVDGVTQIISRVVCDLEIKRDEVILDDRKAKAAYAAALGKRWDVFISHASEDKQEFVRPLAGALEESGLSVWYDESSLTVGDSLRRKIDEGLVNSRYGVVILSHSFFLKNWPQHELDGLMSREVAGNKVILPVWHNIGVDEVRSYSPILAGLVAVQSGDGLLVVVQKLRAAMGLEVRLIPAPATAQDGYSRIERAMPELLAEMRRDLEVSPLSREFIAISKLATYWYDPNKSVFTYYIENHPELDGKLHILQNLGFIRDIHFNQVPRFVFEEKFVDYLTRSK